MSEALVTIRFRIKNMGVWPDDYPVDSFSSFEEVVRYLIQEEGLFGIVEDEHEIIAIEEA